MDSSCLRSAQLAIPMLGSFANQALVISMLIDLHIFKVVLCRDGHWKGFAISYLFDRFPAGLSVSSKDHAAGSFFITRAAVRR
jgi:hypothetical protein